MSDSAGLFGRWQARREAVAAEAAAEREQLETNDSNQPIASDASGEPAIPVSASADEANTATAAQAEVVAEPLPDPESIEVGGSFARFMGQDVDPLTRKAALRALWKQPQYNQVDGLLEYALDYSNHPKLSSDVSMELAKKVFRHLVDSATDEADKVQVAATLAAPADNLPEVVEGVSQNDAAKGGEPPAQVV